MQKHLNLIFSILVLINLISLVSAANDTIIVKTDNSKNAMVTFTSDLAGTEECFGDELSGCYGGEKTIYFAHDDRNDDGGVRALLADSANRTIHAVEGENIKVIEHMIINSGDYGRIVTLTEIVVGNTEVTSKIQLEDVITGKNIFEGGLTVGNDRTKSTTIDGQLYHFTAINGSSQDNSYVSVVWGDGSSIGNFGNARTVFPIIKLKNGEWFAMLTETSIYSGDSVILPGDISRKSFLMTVPQPQLKVGNINYLFHTSGSRSIIYAIDTNNDGVADCNFDKEHGPAILFLEEPKQGYEYGEAVCIPLTTEGAGVVEIAIGKPVSTDSTFSLAKQDDYTSRGITFYGTFVEYDTHDNNQVKISYPESQILPPLGYYPTPAPVGGGGGVAKPKTCIDSDAGINYSIKGTIQNNTGEYSDFCQGSSLIEYYCENNESKSISYVCDYGCFNGECLQQNKTNETITCTAQWKCIDSYNKAFQLTNCTLTDTAFCQYSCYNGACIPQPTTCSDGTSYNSCSIMKPKYCENGTLTDRCNLCGCDEGYTCQANETCIKIKEVEEKENITNNSIICQGCLENNTCIPFNTRKLEMYCDLSSKFLPQKEGDMNCENNFECKSNICIASKCVSEGLWQKFLEWIKDIFKIFFR